MKTYKTITIDDFFFINCTQVVNEYNRNLNLNFHNYIAEMHCQIIKNKSNYGMFSNDPIKKMKIQDFNEFKGKLWRCAYVYYHAEYNSSGIRPTSEELNKRFWLEKTHIELINEINHKKQQLVFNPDSEIMQFIFS